jgi:arginase
MVSSQYQYFLFFVHISFFSHISLFSLQLLLSSHVFLSSLYSTIPSNEFALIFMSTVPARKCKIIGSAVSIGQPLRGVENAPEELKQERIESLISRLSAEWVEIVRQPAYRYDPIRSEGIRNIPDLELYFRRLYDVILREVSAEDFLLTVGGDHSLASTTISAMLAVHSQNLAVVWLDAHGDCNTPETSPSGNYHGMPLGHVMGWFEDSRLMHWGQPKLRKEAVVLVAIRDLDPLEEQKMIEEGIRFYTMREIRSRGIDEVMGEAMKYVDPLGEKMIHFSLDVDGLDPSLVPGTGTLAAGGMDLEEFRVVAKHLKAAGDRFRSMDLVEVNLAIEREKTLETTKRLLAITLGDE